MPRPRSVVVPLAIAFSLLTLFGARSRGQAPASGVLVDSPGLPAIERGRSQDLSHAPDSPESRMRAGLRSELRRERVGTAGTRYAAGKVIVKYRSGTTTAGRLSAMSVAAASASTQPSNADFDILRIADTEDAEAVARTLSARPDVEYAQAAYLCHTQFVPNDEFYKQDQWNLPLINLEAAWDIQPAAGSSITVAVVDTGVAYTNVTMRYVAGAFTDIDGVRYPALGPLTLPFVAATQLGPLSRFVSPHDFIWDTNLPLDLDGHGTHVSGTIGQTTNDMLGTAGVAFNVKLMPVKVVNTDWDDIFNSPNEGTDDVVARGIRYAVDNGAKVINMSIGRNGPAAPVVADAVRYAVSRGAFVAIAAGNAFESGNPVEVYAQIAETVSGAVAVSAVDRSATAGDHRCLGTPASPDCHAYYSTKGTYVELAAPGGSFRGFNSSGGILQQTLSLGDVDTFLLPPARYATQPPRFDTLQYFYYIGTSQATPHVSGVAAMLMQQGITDPAAIEAALERFAVDLGATGRDTTYGFGLVDARAALRGLGLAK